MTPAANAPAMPVPGVRLPGFAARHRRTLTAAVAFVLVVGFVYFAVPKLMGLGASVQMLRGGEPKWLAFGAVLEGLSLGAYMAVFRTVFSVRASHRLEGELPDHLAGSRRDEAVRRRRSRGGRADGLGAARRGVGRGASPAPGVRVLPLRVYAGALVVAGVGLAPGCSRAAPLALTVAPAALGASPSRPSLHAALPDDFEHRLKGSAASRRDIA